MSIKLVQWEDSTVTPTNDRIIYDNGYNGIIEGCAITSLGLNMLHIGDGYVRILGGLIEIVGQDIEVETSASGNKKGQLWIRLDLGSSTPVEFMTEAAATLSTLTQNAKANYENGVYEFQLCTYDISETTISNLAITAESAPSIKALFNDVVTAANESETSSTTPRDSDLLDGHPASYFATNDSLNALTDYIYVLPEVKYTQLPSQSTDNQTFFKEWIDYMVANNKFKIKKMGFAVVIPNSYGFVQGLCYENPKQYCSFVFYKGTTAYTYRFGYNNSVWFWDTLNNS